MIDLNQISASLNALTRRRENPGVIILNQEDFEDIRGKGDFGYVRQPGIGNPETLFGVKLLIIPIHLKNPRFLELGKALVLEKKYWDFLKESLNKEWNCSQKDLYNLRTRTEKEEVAYLIGKYFTGEITLKFLKIQINAIEEPFCSETTSS